MRVASAVSTSGCQWDTTAATMQWICRWWTCNLSVWQQQNSLFHVLERWKKSTNKNSRFVWEFLQLEIRLKLQQGYPKKVHWEAGVQQGGSEKLSHPFFWGGMILIGRKFKASQQFEAFGVTFVHFFGWKCRNLCIRLSFHRFFLFVTMHTIVTCPNLKQT